MPLTIATWNVNSVRARLPRLLSWLERRRPDVVCLQETKVVDEGFPRAEIEALGYCCTVHGQATYNGVAILARELVSGEVRGLPGDGPDAQARLVSCVVGGVRVISAYAPNGGDVGLPAYGFKLEWYARLRAWLDAALDPAQPVALCGDLNVAPDDRDVWDPALWRDRILFSEPEKAAFRSLIDWGFQDTLRLHTQEGGIYSYWDYRAGAFHRRWGLRIDHVLATPPLAARSTGVEIDREERKGPKPSDHAPVVASFER